MILLKKKFDFKTNCKHFTGEYVIAHNDPAIKNNMTSRGIDCLYLQASNATQGYTEFYNLHTGKIITRKHCTSVKIDKRVLDIINNRFIKAESTHVWLAGVELSEDIIKLQEEMDINQMKEIMDTSSNFHIPNINYQQNHADNTTDNTESHHQQNTIENMNNDNNHLPEEKN